MSSLGVTLLILVVLCIGAVIAYNVFQMRRSQRSSPSISDFADGEMGTRAEPSLDSPDVFVRNASTTEQAVAPAPIPTSELFETTTNESPNTRTAHELAPGPVTDTTAEPAMFQGASTAIDAIMGPATVSTDDRPAGHEVSGQLGTVPDDSGLPAGSTVQSDEIAESAVPPEFLVPQTSTPETKPVVAEVINRVPVPSSEIAKFEAIVVLGPLAATSGERLLQLTRDIQRVGGKPVVVTGRTAQDVQEPLRNGHAYKSLQFALLLANRNGPVNAIEYSDFVNKVQAVADELDLLADVPDMAIVLDRARELSAEVGALDAQVAVNVDASAPLSIEDLRRLARPNNLKEQGNNLYVRLDEEAHPVFSVTLGDKTNRLEMLLDVPRVSRDRAPIREMIECAWKCARDCDGQMVDDSGRPIDNQLFERIESQLEIHYQALQGAGLPAGSRLARRVFS